MKNYIIIWLVTAVLLSSQAKKEVEFPQNTANRSVDGTILISDKLPKIKIKVDDEFKFIGNFDFEIIALSDEYKDEVKGKAIAAGERFVFAVADVNKVVEKLFIVQLEGFLPGFDFKFNYNFANADFIGDNKYRHNTWFYDSKKLAEQNPHGEGAKTRLFLEEKGFKLEDQFMMSRFVGLASEDRKNEIIIFYIEMLNGTTGYTLEEYENLKDGEEAKTIDSSFVERSKKSFTIIEG